MQNTSTLDANALDVAKARQSSAAQKFSSGWTILSIALALGVMADVLFYKQSLGFNAMLFAALTLGGIVSAFMRERQTPFVRRNLWLALPILFFATMVFLRAEPFLTFLNVVATLLLLGVLFTTLGTNPLERLTVVAYPLTVLIGGILSVFSAAPLIGFVWSRLFARTDRVSLLLRIALGLALALPFLIIFGALFSSADAVFAQGVRNILNLDFLKHLPDYIAQLMWIGFVSWLAAGALLMSLERARQAQNSAYLERPVNPAMRIGFVEAATVLAAVNGLFLVFVAIQFTYLFGGGANVNVAGFTYAEYARRGFFELVAVAVVTMGLLLALDWVAKREGGQQIVSFKILCTALTALVLVILASAFQRMSLYESAYGFTSLRVYTHWFMLWMGVVFILKAVALWLSRGQVFAFGGFVSLIIALAGFNLLNPDAFIAEQNIRRYLEGGKFGPAAGVTDASRRSTALDSDYVTSLSEDATPILIAYFDQLQGAEREHIGGVLRARKDDLYQQLSSAQWPSYHWARKQALDALLTKQDALNQYKPIRR